MSDVPVFMNHESALEERRRRTRAALSASEFQRRAAISLAVISTFQSAKTIADVLQRVGTNPTDYQNAILDRLEREVSNAFAEMAGVDLVSAITKGVP